MKFILFFILIATTNSYAQRVSFKEIKRKPKSEFFNIDSITIRFPIIITKNKTVSKLINDRIKNDFFTPDDEKMRAVSLLGSFIADGLINLSYETTLNRNGILSLKIYAEGCAAHCSSWTTYFNFDLNSGKPITIQDLIQSDKLENLRQKVLDDKDSLLKIWKLEEKENLAGKEIDSLDYKFVIEYVEENCQTTLDLTNISLFPEYLEIADSCEFPIVFRSHQPSYQLQYSYETLKPFLKKKFLLKLK